MIHLKVMLIDDRVLVMGSSNFDMVSYRAEQEIVALVTDAAAIREVTRRVLEPDLEASRPATTADMGWGSPLCSLQLRAIEVWALVAARIPPPGRPSSADPPVLSGAHATLLPTGDGVYGGARCERRLRCSDSDKRGDGDRGGGVSSPSAAGGAGVAAHPCAGRRGCSRDLAGGGHAPRGGRRTARARVRRS